MPVPLAVAQASIQALSGRTTNEFLASIAGHAFTQHMSKAAAAQAAQEANQQKGYFERIKTVRVQTTQAFAELSPKDKVKALPNQQLWKNKKPGQYSKHITNKDLHFEATRSVDVNDMAALIHEAVQHGNAGDFRHGGVEGRFLYFTPVPDGFVARAMTPAGIKLGGGGIAQQGLPWSTLVVVAGVGTNVVVVSAYPTDDAYRLLWNPL